jgi:hypothetical protein
MFGKYMHIYYCMEIIMLMAEMLLTPEIENILGTVKHCNRKVTSQVVTRMETT